MKVLNFGSLNLDYVYQVPHFVQPGETLSASSLTINCGGKGLNQSIALARAGLAVYHAGKIGADGEMLRSILSENNVNTDYLLTSLQRTGNAIIQVDSSGQNSIVLFAGANHDIDDEMCRSILENFSSDDCLLLQNEINNLPLIIEEAYRKGMRIILNPSPANEIIFSLPLEKISIFLLNEIEGEMLSGKQNPDEIISVLASRYPNSCIVLTLGKEGSVCYSNGKTYYHPSFPVNAVDTTAAGDTFTGYFLASYLSSTNIHECLRKASLAASIAVSRPGAAASIPYPHELCQ